MVCLVTHVPFSVDVWVTGHVVTVVYVVMVTVSVSPPPPHRTTFSARAEAAKTRSERAAFILSML